MPDSSLHTHLAGIRQAAAAHRKDLAQELADCRGERARLQSEIARLQEQLAAADAACARLDAELANAPQVPAGEAAAVIAAFAETREQLTPLLAYLRDRQALQARQAAFLATDPTLPTLLSDYQIFEADPEAALHALPPSYRTDLLDGHKARGERLAPYFALEQTRAALPVPPALCLPIVVVQDPVGPHIIWLLPIPAALPGADHIQDTLVDNLCTSFRSLGDQPGWCVLDDITRDQWAGYTALRALAQYTGSAPLAGAVQNALAGTLSQLPAFVTIPVTIEVAEMGREAWQPQAAPASEPAPSPSAQVAEPTQPQEAFPTPETEAAAPPDYEPALAPASVVATAVSLVPQQLEGEPAPQTPGDTEAQPMPPAPAPPLAVVQSLGKQSSGWYTGTDIEFWEHRSKTADLSPITVQKRRMRTLLTRLIARGKVGGATAPRDLLWSALPEPHREEMRAEIDLLIAREVLLPVDSHPDGGPGITVNPAMLGQVQGLLTEDSAAFWSTLVGDPGNITELRSATAPASRLPPLRPRRTG